MFKGFNFLLCLLLLASVIYACKPVRKSYVPYRKRSKCGCPTYGHHQKDKHDAAFMQQIASKTGSL
jgi:hypothetical protein